MTAKPAFLLDIMSPYLSESFAAQSTVHTSKLRDALPYVGEDPTCLPTTLDPFTITTSTGFLPFHHPVVNLPLAFDKLTALLEEMPIVKEDGTPGLLASYQLGPTIDKGDALPDLMAELDALTSPATGEPDLALITAAFRDYAYLASA